MPLSHHYTPPDWHTVVVGRAKKLSTILPYFIYWYALPPSLWFTYAFDTIVQKTRSGSKGRSELTNKKRATFVSAALCPNIASSVKYCLYTLWHKLIVISEYKIERCRKPLLRTLQYHQWMAISAIVDSSWCATIWYVRVNWHTYTVVYTYIRMY